MDNSRPGCSKDVLNFDDNIMKGEIDQLKEIHGLNVWSEHQDVLEKQALEELEIFTKDNVGKEDGELSDSSKRDKIIDINQKPQLDIESYIKRQEELKRIQEHKKISKVSEKSRIVAENISKRQKLKSKESKKRQGDINEKLDHVNVKKVKIATDDESLSRSKHKEVVSDSDYYPSDLDSEDSNYEIRSNNNRSKKSKSRNNSRRLTADLLDKVVDDGSLDAYKNRLETYYKKLEKERELLNIDDAEDYVGDENVEIISNVKVPHKLWNKLYDYQQEGVRWLLMLHKKLIGGLLGDEMGLGKTVQIIVFLFTLNYNNLSIKQGRYIGLGPTIIVSPATVVHQWVKHFQEWAPEFRVALLHQSGSYIGNMKNLIKEINGDKGVLITTYTGFLKYQGYLVEHSWHYLILDEGHKIRNPNSQISAAVKRINTPHKILLTGSPMQNNLQELWSLFDFIIPGLLGTLQVFTEHFVNPIIHGGFANSTSIQEATALSVAVTLKNIISPYLLRRTKSEVQEHIRLPNKKEQVLFCKLTEEQIDLYKGYLMTDHVNTIIGRKNKNWYSENQMRANMLIAITSLRKICNHPDLYIDNFNQNNEEDDEEAIDETYRHYKRSGKMVVVSALLKLWKKQNHRVLLFTQARAMILIFEEFLKKENYTYLKMDGSTSVNSRQTIIEKFNKDETYTVFLLTTRVGGVGINLTGANRVIIYDPDWNPATDTQARERAWRIGQNKDVTIYRLISAGTIEEKMYQRQIWKQLLSNKVLVDPKTQKFFRNSNLHDLFSLQESPDETNTETANIFKNSRIEMQKKLDERKKKKKKNHEVVFSEDKIRQMRNLAQQISKNLIKDTEPETKSKNTMELELKIEKIEKRNEREYLKTLTPTQLRDYNKQRLNRNEDDSINEIDGYKTDITFAKALDLSEETSKLHNDLQHKKDVLNNLNNINTEKLGSFVNHKKGKSTCEISVDNTGRIDGETIAGLIKTEIKKTKTKKNRKNNEAKSITTETQDDYVLNKLFSKNGIHTALQHDTIICNSENGGNRFRIENEARAKADLALEAIKKSRLNKWQW